MLAVLLSLLVWPLAIWAQSDSDTTSITTAPSPTTGSPVQPTGIICWKLETIQFDSTDIVATSVEFPFPSAGFNAIPNGAVCFEIYSTAGGYEQIPITTVGFVSSGSPGVTDYPRPTGPFHHRPQEQNTGSSGPNLKVILPAVLGSVLVAGILIVALIYLRKARRSARPDGRWLQRPGGWTRDEKVQNNDIPLKQRSPVEGTSGGFAV